MRVSVRNRGTLSARQVEPIRIAAFGDSFVAGFGLAPEDYFLDDLTEALELDRGRGHDGNRDLGYRHPEPQYGLPQDVKGHGDGGDVEPGVAQPGRNEWKLPARQRDRGRPRNGGPRRHLNRSQRHGGSAY